MGNISKSERVNRLVEHFGRGNKSEFARIIGTTPQVVATWITRDTLNYDLVYAKCEGINPEWLLTGDGEMLKAVSSFPSVDSSSGITQLVGVIQELTANLSERNQEIGDLREQIGRAEATIVMLKAELAKHAKDAGDVTSAKSALAV